jgi:hypothetical protein
LRFRGKSFLARDRLKTSKPQQVTANTPPTYRPPSYLD